MQLIIIYLAIQLKIRQIINHIQKTKIKTTIRATIVHLCHMRKQSVLVVKLPMISEIINGT